MKKKNRKKTTLGRKKRAMEKYSEKYSEKYPEKYAKLVLCHLWSKRRMFCWENTLILPPSP